MKKLIIAVVLLGLLGIGSILFIGRTYYPDNVAETSVDGGKKELKTRFSDKSVTEVRKIAKEEINKLSSWGGSWVIVDETDGGKVSEFKVEIPVLVFTDDMTVTIKEEDSRTRIDVRSASRVGKSDFGENARNVRKLLAALDLRLK